MSDSAPADDEDRFQFLNVFCSPLGKSWRIYAHPSFMPQYLAQHFDRHLEAHAAALDWAELERYMGRKGAAYESRIATNGCIELTARGDSAPLLGAWLATAMGTGLRPH